jgi:hypothetical protein
MGGKQRLIKFRHGGGVIAMFVVNFAQKKTHQENRPRLANTAANFAINDHVEKANESEQKQTFVKVNNAPVDVKSDEQMPLIALALGPVSISSYLNTIKVH